MEQMETMETRERTGTQAAGHDFIEVSHLKRYFPIRRGVFSRVSGYVRAVDDVSFSIRKGEILGLVGESGCGKSTTEQDHALPAGGHRRQHALRRGTVFDVEKGVATRGQEMQRLRRSMQIIFQDPYASLDPRKTIGYIVTEGILKHKLAASRREALEQAKEMLERCGIRQTPCRNTRTSFPAASASASASRARSCSGRASSSATSRSPRSTRPSSRRCSRFCRTWWSRST